MPAPFELLRGVPYLAPLSPRELEELQSRAIRQTFGRGALIFLENDPAPGMYLVESGRVKLFKTSPEGREQVLRLIGPGQSFNDVAVFDGGPNPVAAAALDRAVVYLLPKANVVAAVRGHPESAIALAREFAGRLRNLSDLVEDLSFRHVTSRLAKLLLQYTEQGDTSIARPRFTQQELASMVGSVREVVGRSLAGLEKEGAIRIDRARIVVTDREALRRLA
jgi:CRP/FNR family transcriptional regulator